MRKRTARRGLGVHLLEQCFSDFSLADPSLCRAVTAQRRGDSQKWAQLHSLGWVPQIRAKEDRFIKRTVRDGDWKLGFFSFQDSQDTLALEQRISVVLRLGAELSVPLRCLHLTLMTRTGDRCLLEAVGSFLAHLLPPPFSCSCRIYQQKRGCSQQVCSRCLCDSWLFGHDFSLAQDSSIYT